MNPITSSRRFEGKVAVVTGGASGIGLAIARRIGAEGGRVKVVDLHPERAFEAASAICENGGQAEGVACDVSDTSSVRVTFASIEKIDILVNSAGIAHVGSLEKTTAEDLDRIYAVNVKGVYHAMYFALPKMLGAGGGAIVNLASIASKVGIADRFAYSMSKGAVLSMTLSVARDYVQHGIRCNCLCPARVHTAFVDGFIEKNYPDQKKEMFRQLSEYQPLGRMGQPEEIASLAAYLCSEEAAFITGASYDIDGGVISLR